MSANDIHARKMSAYFAVWWFNIGSGISPRHREEQIIHAERVARNAFSAGATYALEQMRERFGIDQEPES